MVLPKPVYESLPYAYLLIGLLSLSLLDGMIRYLPGIMMCVAGVTVLNWRISYRHDPDRDEFSVGPAVVRRGK